MRTKAPHVVHVARECAEIVAAGGVGDVVLQLALECVKQGLHSTIFLPHYGRYSHERQRALAERISAMLPWQHREVRYLDPAAYDIPMAYSDNPHRTEPAAIETIQFSGPARLQVVQVVADRFVGKQRPYTYTAGEVKAILEAAQGDRMVCGAEPPPKAFPLEEGSGHFDYFAMNVLLQKAALAWIEKPAPPCHRPLPRCPHRHVADDGQADRASLAVRGQPLRGDSPQLRRFLSAALRRSAVRGSGERPASDGCVPVRDRGRIRSVRSEQRCTPTTSPQSATAMPGKSKGRTCTPRAVTPTCAASRSS